MDKEKFIQIADKISSGTADHQEIKQFNRYFNQYQQEYAAWEELDHTEKEVISQVIKKRIQDQIKITSGPKKIRLWLKFVAAAAVLIILSTSVYIYQVNNLPENKILAKKEPDIAPGSNKAYLTLSNGQKINLSDAQNAHLAEQSGVNITKTEDGQLIYQIANTNQIATGTNFIETPKGGQYKIRLPDGTQVWLNSSSSMRYPINFSGKKRIVEIKGEAYFEVAHNEKMPFVVKSIKQEIEVLGTHFNVMAYDDENEVETTLLQGSVKVSTEKNALLLKPGQQAQVKNTSALLNLDVDLESTMAWKVGKIQFSEMNIQNIMRMLSRWYDFDASYIGKPINTTFGGSFSRSKNLSIILKALESTGDVHFKIEGRRVTVMP